MSMLTRRRRTELLDRCYYYNNCFYSPPPLFFGERTSVLAPPKTLACPSLVVEEVEEFDDLPAFSLDVLDPSASLFDAFTELIRIDETPSFHAYRRVQRRAGSDLELLCDRVAALESRFERIVNCRRISDEKKKFTWTAEIEGPEVDRKYKWTADVKGGKTSGEKWTAEIKRKGQEEKYKWTAEIKGAASGDDAGECNEFGKKKKKEKENIKEQSKEKKKGIKTRIVEIHDAAADHGAVVLKQAFAKRSRAAENAKGKKKELAPQDAALMIQMYFRAYLIRRSKALRALRELAVSKTKLKEIRALFNNFSYRRQVAQDAEERQKFSEKIIVLLLTVDAIEGTDLMVRAAKRSMIDELEAMLDVIDPQPAGKSLSMRRRTFDMPDGVIRKEIAEGVAQVVQMIDGEGNSESTFEACV